MLLLYSCRFYAILEVFETLEQRMLTLRCQDTVVLTLSSLLCLGTLLLINHSCYRVPGLGICDWSSCGSLRRSLLLCLVVPQDLHCSYRLLLQQLVKRSC